METLELTEPTTDATILFEMGTDGVSGRVVNRDVLGELEVVARLVDAVAELLVAAGLQAVIEEADVREHLAADEQTAGGGESLTFEVPLDRKSGVVIVARGEGGVVGEREVDGTAHVVGVGGLELAEGVLEPVLRDGHVGVDEREQVGVRVADAGVAGCVGGLDVRLVAERDPVVVVRADDVGGAVGGVVVDDY